MTFCVSKPLSSTCNSLKNEWDFSIWYNLWAPCFCHFLWKWIFLWIEVPLLKSNTIFWRHLSMVLKLNIPNCLGMFWSVKGLMFCLNIINSMVVHLGHGGYGSPFHKNRINRPLLSTPLLMSRCCSVTPDLNQSWSNSYKTLIKNCHSDLAYMLVYHPVPNWLEYRWPMSSSSKRNKHVWNRGNTGKQRNA